MNGYQDEEKRRYDDVKESTYKDVSPASSQHEESELLAAYDHAAQKKIIHRIDFRLIPICGFMYCVSLLDRTNLSNAAIAGYVISYYAETDY